MDIINKHILAVIIMTSLFGHVRGQTPLVVLPNSTLSINCTLATSCAQPSWKIGESLYSYYSLSNSIIPNHFADENGMLIIENVNSERNETRISCLSLEFNVSSANFTTKSGQETKLIVAASPQQTQTPEFSILTGCGTSIQWTAPFDNHKSIEYYLISLATNTSAQTFNTTAPVLNYTIQNLAGGVMYFLSISAVNIVGPGMYSPAASFQIPSQAPTPLCSVDSKTHESISISWTIMAYNGSSVYNVTFVINYSDDANDRSAGTATSDIVLGSLAANTQYSINVTSAIPGFTDCIRNATCSLSVTTLTAPSSAPALYAELVTVLLIAALVIFFI